MRYAAWMLGKIYPVTNWVLGLFTQMLCKIFFYIFLNFFFKLPSFTQYESGNYYPILAHVTHPPVEKNWVNNWVKKWVKTAFFSQCFSPGRLSVVLFVSLVFICGGVVLLGRSTAVFF